MSNVVVGQQHVTESQTVGYNHQHNLARVDHILRYLELSRSAFVTYFNFSITITCSRLFKRRVQISYATFYLVRSSGFLISYCCVEPCHLSIRLLLLFPRISVLSHLLELAIMFTLVFV